MASSFLSVENGIRIYDDPDEDLEDDLLPEYHFDPTRAKPNPYAARVLCRKAVSLEADSPDVYHTLPSVCINERRDKPSD